MVRTKEINNKDQWETFVLERPEANFLQSWNWGEFHNQLGHTIYREGIFDDSKLVGLFLAIKEKAKRGIYLTIPGGPLIDWSNKLVKAESIKRIREIAKVENCSFVRIRPQSIENSNNEQILKDLGFINAPMHLHAELTHQLDLSKTEDELLSQMRKATRYEIKQAQKLGIRIETGVDIEDFYKIQLDTAKRQKFVPFGREFLQKQFEVFSKEDQAVLFTAWFGEIKLAQAFVIFYGREADYHYGVSTEAARKYPGAYLIQWEAIREAKKRGIERYNFWGVSPEGVKDHRFSGVSLFKRGFGGVDVAYCHARDLVIDKFRYLPNWLIESFRKHLRKV
jgi:lipid II:glycine glycyltransferase (peptidoglycan interpeptide bridge formation enzyme)